MSRYKKYKQRVNQQITPKAEPVVTEQEVMPAPEIEPASMQETAPVPKPKPEPKLSPKTEPEWEGAHLGDVYICVAQTYFGDKNTEKLYEVGEEFTVRRDHQVLPKNFVTKETRAKMLEEERLQKLREDAKFEDSQAALRKVQLGI